MSKVKKNYITIFPDTPRMKAKFKKNLRRREEIILKHKRMADSKRIGRYGYKYYVEDERNLYQICREYVPEHEVPVRTLKKIKVETDGGSYETLEWVTIGYKTVPGHYRKYHKYLGTEETEPYLKRWNDRKFKKYLKRQASKSVRRLSIDDTPKKGKIYKRAFGVRNQLY